jgi:acetyl esterase/lipase
MAGDPAGRNGVFLVLVGAGLGGVVGAILLAASFLDAPALSGIPEGWMSERNLAYGDDPRQRLDLVRERTPSKSRPALLLIHPGGWLQGDKAAYHEVMAEYGGRGYVTAAPNFRLSGTARYPAAIRDCKQALRWLRSNASRCGIDPGRIGVMGYSSGAHLAMLLALSDEGFERSEAHPDVSQRVQAAVGVSGVYDFLMERQGAFPNADDDPAVVLFLGAPAREVPERARSASPIRHLTSDDPPFLVFHGELDRRIDAEQARNLASALKTIGRSDSVILLKGQGHGKGVLPAGEESRTRIAEFFDRHLRPGG